MKWLSIIVALSLLTGCIKFSYPPEAYPGGPEYANRDQLFPDGSLMAGLTAPQSGPSNHYPYWSLDYFYMGHGYGRSSRHGWGYDPWYGYYNPWAPMYWYPPYQYHWYSAVNYNYHTHYHHYYAWQDPYWRNRYEDRDGSSPGLALDKPDYSGPGYHDATEPGYRQVRDAQTGDLPPNDFESGDNAAFRQYNNPNLISQRTAPGSSTGAPMTIRSPRDSKPGLSRTHPNSPADDGAGIKVISPGVTPAASEPIVRMSPSYRVAPIRTAPTRSVTQPIDVSNYRVVSQPGSSRPTVVTPPSYRVPKQVTQQVSRPGGSGYSRSPRGYSPETRSFSPANRSYSPSAGSFSRPAASSRSTAPSISSGSSNAVSSSSLNSRSER